MMSIVLGALTIFLGGWGLLHWWNDTLWVLKGLLPLSFICGGLVAIVAGASSLKK